MKNKLLEVYNLNKTFYSARGGTIQAVKDVSFFLEEEETVGLIGESGSGKTTVGRTLLMLHKPDYGLVNVNGREVANGFSKKSKNHLYRNMQMIFQDPYSSLNDQKNVISIIKESLVAKKQDRELLQNWKDQREDVIKYFGLSLEQHYLTTLYKYKKFKYDKTLQTYKKIYADLKKVKIDSQNSRVDEYQKIFNVFYKQKTDANNFILKLLNKSIKQLYAHYKTKQIKVLRGTFEYFDEKELLEIEKKYKQIKSFGNLNSKQVEVKKQIVSLEQKKVERTKYLQDTLVKTKLETQSLLRMMKKQKRFVSQQMHLQTCANKWNLLLFRKKWITFAISLLSEIKKSKTKILIPNLTGFFVKTEDNLSQNFVSKNTLNKNVASKTVTKQIRLFNFTKSKESFKNLVEQGEIKYNKVYSEIKNFQNQIKNYQNQIKTLASKVQSKNTYKAKLKKTLAQMAKARKINLLENQKYFEKELVPLFKEIRNHDKTFKAKTAEIKRLSCECEKLRKNLMEKVFSCGKENLSSKTKKEYNAKIRTENRNHEKFNSEIDKEIVKNEKSFALLEKFLGIYKKHHLSFSQKRKKLPVNFWRKMQKDLVKQKVFQTLEKVGLSIANAYSYPHEFSGGMRQRVAIARAIISNPKIIIADEPVSNLDLSIQAQIVNLFSKLKKQLKLSMIFIAHDLPMVRYIADRVIIMHLGKIVEYGKTEEIFKNPVHPYLKNLINEIPSITKKASSFKKSTFKPSYLEEYQKQEPKYCEVSKTHHVLANESQFKKWTKK